MPEDGRPAPETPSTPEASGRHRLLTTIAILFVLGACATLPWAIPQLPNELAAAVAGGARSTHPIDPPVSPAVVAPDSTTPVPEPIARRLAAAGPPLEVVVPRLGVSSTVVPISGQSGELVPPSDPQVLGFWQEGREAGAALGSLVVTGHTVHTGGGAFDHLGELVPGDRISVRTAKGWVGYVVTTSRTLSVRQLARRAAAIFRRDGSARLVLITCSDFDGQIYRSSSVVLAVPVQDEPFGSVANSDHLAARAAFVGIGRMP